VHQFAVHSARFRIRRELGAGGMGVVYEAQDAVTHATVALKTLRNRDDEALYQFKREFRLLAALGHHPNLVRLGELFCEHDQWFFTMELIRGQTLLDYVQAPPGAPLPFDEGRLRAAFRQLADGLCALHAAGYVHRDIKPSNVLVSTEGRVVLLDFGIAAPASRRKSQLSAEPTLVGTPAYMAPEQTELVAIRREVDAYAVGVMMFKALTGELPFSGTPMEIVVEKERRRAPAPSELVGGVPPDLERMCVELLERNPALRPTAAELLRRLGGDGAASLAARDHDADDEAFPFVGRADELGRLNQALTTIVRGGSATSLVIQGEAGIGKTALVEHFLARARAAHPGLVALAGRCYEQEFVPFKAFDGIIDALGEHLRQLAPDELPPLVAAGLHFATSLFPALRRVPVVAQAVPLCAHADKTSDRRARAFEELRRLLAAVAERAPLVLFVDDLQWIDSDSRALLEELLRPTERLRCLVIATMRVAADELTGDAAQAARLGALFTPLLLRGLGRADSAALVNELVPQALSPQQTEALIQDSRGHPLFLLELLQSAGSAADHDVAGTPWEDLLRRRLGALDAVDRLLLEVAAIAGVPLPHVLTARVAGVDPADGLARLDRLRHARMLRSIGGAGDRRIAPFHDRVRAAIIDVLGEAADAATVSARRQGLHLAIGRSLLADTAADALDEELFTIVHHLQQGAALMDTRDERRQLIALGLRAARKAKLATAYQAALGYVSAAELLLDDEARELGFALCKEHIELEYLIGNANRAQQRFIAAVSEPRSDGEYAELYALMIELLAARSQFVEAVALTRKGLRRFGVTLPERPGPATLLRELLLLRLRQGRRTLERLEELPESRDEHMRAAAQLLMAVTPAAVSLDRTLVSVSLVKIASMSLQYGATAHSAYGFLGYGMVLTGAFHQYRRGFEIAELALRLDERFGSGALEARLFYLAGAYLTAWVRPYAEALARLRRSMDAGLRLGDLAYRTYSAGVAASMVEMRSAPIDEIVEALTTARDIARRSREPDWIAVSELRLLAYDRLCQTHADPTSLATDPASEAELRDGLSDARTPLGMGTFYFYKAMLCFHFERYDEAFGHLVDVDTREGTLFANVALANRAFYRVLITSERVGRRRGEDKQLRRTIARSVARLRGWARQCPANFAPRWLIAEAEAARVAGASRRAMRAYAAAIAAARTHGAVGIEALALERAARHLGARGHANEAAAQRAQAIAAYRRWGAHAKAAQLACDDERDGG
jgi:predicted ATPase